jgi:excisionase family DNA binding protein
MVLFYDSDYLTVQEAARILGVSARSVYGYIAKGKLPATRIGERMMVKAQDVSAFELTPAGRRRERAPFWHVPPEMNHLSVAIIKVRVRPGCDALLDGKLSEFQAARKHCLAGTSARYIGRNQCDPSQIEILLFWRKATMPSDYVQKASLSAFYIDLEEVVEWETAVVEEIHVLLHAVS